MIKYNYPTIFRYTIVNAVVVTYLTYCCNQHEPVDAMSSSFVKFDLKNLIGNKIHYNNNNEFVSQMVIQKT